LPFFDFADAFGNVDRKILIKTIREDFGISGRLLHHIADFLSDRDARINVNSLTGEWYPSLLGTSAGTVLGPILFIMHIHKAPSCIKPKFADDFTSVATGNSSGEVEISLQEHVNATVEWCKERKMTLNASKTKVMYFTKDSLDTNINIMINGEQVEQTNQVKYLGYILDSKLSLKPHIEFTCGKALRSMSKIGLLMKGRNGLNVKLGIELYVTLVRPHLEYALPAWAFLMTSSQMEELEKTQAQCLKKIMGLHVHTSTEALHVASGVIPMRFRAQELCEREFTRLLENPLDHPLREIMPLPRTTIKTPLSYLRFQSKDILNELESLNCKIGIKALCNPATILEADFPGQSHAITSRAGNSKTRTKQQETQAKSEMDSFISNLSHDSLLVFTDGSISNRGGSLPATVGFGACSAVLVDPADNNRKIKGSQAVGNITDNVECETQGIALALELLEKYMDERVLRAKKCFIFCDCKAAIEIACNQRNKTKHLEALKKIWGNTKKLKARNSSVDLIWCPGHCNIKLNEEADQLAKEKARETAANFTISSASRDIITCETAKKIIQKKIIDKWQSSWNRQVTGAATHSLVPMVGSQICWSKKRSTDISYARMILNSTNLLDH